MYLSANNWPQNTVRKICFRYINIHYTKGLIYFEVSETILRICDNKNSLGSDGDNRGFTTNSETFRINRIRQYFLSLDRMQKKAHQL